MADETSFFRKERKLSTGLVEWCGNPERKHEVPVYYGASSKSSKISMKDLNKRRQQKQRKTINPEVCQAEAEPKI